MLKVFFIMLFFGESLYLSAQELRSRAIFGHCPKRMSGNLSMLIMKQYLKTKSLWSVRQWMKKEQLFEKFYLKSYEISLSPEKKLLEIDVDCPRPLFVFQKFSKNDGEEIKRGIFVEGGKIFRESYWAILKENHEYKKVSLPILSMEEDGDGHFQEISEIFFSSENPYLKNLAEAILSDDSQLTLIFSMNDGASVAYLGKNMWSEKIKKLERIFHFFEGKDRFPKQMNMMNIKKVVVRF